jgi:hypothetical protein
MIEDGHFNPRHRDNSGEVSDEESQARDKFRCISATTDIKNISLYNESYLSIRFTWSGDSSCPLSLCFVCGRQLTNAAMAPAKLRRHLTINHSHMTSTGADYFKCYWNLKTNRVKIF